MRKQFLVVGFALLVSPVSASDLASGDQIQAAVSGNTISGGMSDGTAYSEFYATDGTIKADGYLGAWSVENDQMCFDYGEGADCWSVSIDGDQVTWVTNGQEAGTGTISAGNPNEF